MSKLILLVRYFFIVDYCVCEMFEQMDNLFHSDNDFCF